MVRFKSILKWALVGLVLFFIYFPILFLTINSFNQSDHIQNWTGFGFDHYAYFFNFENEPIQIVGQTLLLALIVAPFCTVITCAEE